MQNFNASAAPHETVLAIDASQDTLATLAQLLGQDYRLKTAVTSATGLALAAVEPRPDLILLDIALSAPDGHETCRRLKANPLTRDTAVIFLAENSRAPDAEDGLRLGAADYLTKPLSAPLLTARVKTHMDLKRAADLIREPRQFLEEEVARRTRELEFIQDATLLALASVAETRDSNVGDHPLRTRSYVRLLAEQLHDHPRFELLQKRANIELIHRSAPLHDIGMIGIPNHILFKPGRLTAPELAIMKSHTVLGRDAIALAERKLGRTTPFLGIAKQIAYSHQEKWDGSGYPEGLTEERIPIPARLMALADVYDALISPRAYKPALTHDQATALIAEGRGAHFDPDIVDAFIARRREFAEITLRFSTQQENQAAA